MRDRISDTSGFRSCPIPIPLSVHLLCSAPTSPTLDAKVKRPPPQLNFFELLRSSLGDPQFTDVVLVPEAHARQESLDRSFAGLHGVATQASGFLRWLGSVDLFLSSGRCDSPAAIRFVNISFQAFTKTQPSPSSHFFFSLKTTHDQKEENVPRTHGIHVLPRLNLITVCPSALSCLHDFHRDQLETHVRRTTWARQHPHP